MGGKILEFNESRRRQLAELVGIFCSQTEDI